VSEPILDPNKAMVVTIDYGDGTTDTHVVSDGYSAVHLYEDEENYTITVEEVAVEAVDITTTVNGLTVTLDYTGTGIELGSEVFFGDGTGPHYIGPGAEEGPPYDYTYAEAGTYTITVDPLGELFPLVSEDVTVSEGSPEDPVPEDGPTAEVEVDGMDATAAVSYTANTHVRFGWGDGQNGDATTDAQGEAIVSHTYTEPGTYSAFIEDETGTPHTVGDITVPGDTSNYGVEVGYDPAAHTVTEVIGYVEDNADQLEDIIAAEEAGKARVTLLTHLESMRA
jgi:hypothetical protein